jgi:hypothetical protein
MRQDTRKGNGEFFAVIPHAYTNAKGERYYMAIASSDGVWVELSPSYVTRCTKTVDQFPEWLKRSIDHSMGYILNTVPRLG